MHYTIRYNGTPEQKRKQALADAIEYVGTDRMVKVMQYVQGVLEDSELTGRQKINQIRIGLSFAGVQGYPVKAIIRTVYKTM